ncbi:tellurite resistance/C4-dicarboxylate transporter family protein [Streptomyces sp. V4-01]|uniref:Tellurite resistance/C4-dicarboxylate transporter family protein n=1 Tax=Actinacidiphila polyblastidii TaxID=3110430 RepID=A0ABU7P5Q2_9ACTN|nr:tellurite resistance/C4-dicarboxylate transporter family protein [Streptomyces sp. V4-01]
MSRAPRGLLAALRELPPAAGSVVMATAILSVGLETVGRRVLSVIALVLAIVLWVVLAGDFVHRLLGQRARFRTEASTPAALNAVAASAVLGTRLATVARGVPAEALLATAAAVWPFLLVSVIDRWTRGMPGGVFLVCVATEGLAVLSAVLGAAHHLRWLSTAALALFVLGLLLYCVALPRFDPRQIRTGAGDHWIFGGALAICALAGSKLTSAPFWTGAPHSVLRTATLVLFGVVLALYAVLAAAEVRWPRPHYDFRRWATVFPLGMGAVASMSIATATGVRGLHTLGAVLLWAGVAAWLLTASGLITHRT